MKFHRSVLILISLNKLNDVLIPSSMFNDWYCTDLLYLIQAVLRLVLRLICRLEIKLNNFRFTTGCQ